LALISSHSVRALRKISPRILIEGITTSMVVALFYITYIN
jgi:hypothetical protein